MKNVYFNPDMHDVIEKSAKHFILDDVSVFQGADSGAAVYQAGDGYCNLCDCVDPYLADYAGCQHYDQTR